MKANELRIGNLVQYSEDGTLFRVTEIDMEGITVKNDHEEIWIEIDRFNPIPLTEEWLLKFRFEKQNFGWNKNNFGLFDFNYGEGALNLRLNACECPLPFVKYVHQLQNIYFALIGEELLITNQ